MSGGLRVHWQNAKDYNEESLENKDQTEFINLKAHSSGKMQQVLFIVYQQVSSVLFLCILKPNYSKKQLFSYMSWSLLQRQKRIVIY